VEGLAGPGATPTTLALCTTTTTTTTTTTPNLPPWISSRCGLRLRHVKGGTQSFYEVAEPGELERLKPSLTGPEYEAGIQLRLLWASGTMLAEPTPRGNLPCRRKQNLLQKGGPRVSSAQGSCPARVEIHSRGFFDS
jgi:hypothetical protein